MAEKMICNQAKECKQDCSHKKEHKFIYCVCEYPCNGKFKGSIEGAICIPVPIESTSEDSGVYVESAQVPQEPEWDEDVASPVPETEGLGGKPQLDKFCNKNDCPTWLLVGDYCEPCMKRDNLIRDDQKAFDDANKKAEIKKLFEELNSQCLEHQFKNGQSISTCYLKRECPECFEALKKGYLK